MGLPNFDDIELGMLTVAGVVIFGCLTAIVMVRSEFTAGSIAASLSFVSVGITAIGSLARGKNNKNKGG